MSETINRLRVVFLSTIILLSSIEIVSCAENLPAAPVGDIYSPSAVLKQKQELIEAKKKHLKQQHLRRLHIKSDEYHDYDAYLVFDYSNFNCPKTKDAVNGRSQVSYHDDFPMHDTYNAKLPCRDLYYPYNYPIPR